MKSTTASEEHIKDFSTILGFTNSKIWNKDFGKIFRNSKIMTGQPHELGDLDERFCKDIQEFEDFNRTDQKFGKSKILRISRNPGGSTNTTNFNQQDRTPYTQLVSYYHYYDFKNTSVYLHFYYC
jgi:hypothetical protein